MSGMVTILDLRERPASDWEPGALGGLALLVERYGASDPYWLRIGATVLGFRYWERADAPAVAAALRSLATDAERREFAL